MSFIVWNLPEESGQIFDRQCFGLKIKTQKLLCASCVVTLFLTVRTRCHIYGDNPDHMAFNVQKQS